MPNLNVRLRRRCPPDIGASSPTTTRWSGAGRTALTPTRRVDGVCSASGFRQACPVRQPKAVRPELALPTTIKGRDIAVREGGNARPRRSEAGDQGDQFAGREEARRGGGEGFMWTVVRLCREAAGMTGTEGRPSCDPCHVERQHSASLEILTDFFIRQGKGGKAEHAIWAWE